MQGRLKTGPKRLPTRIGWQPILAGMDITVVGIDPAYEMDILAGQARPFGLTLTE